jgi:hypothetical protein
MLAIARYAMKSPFHAATVAGILAVLSLFIPLVSVLSGAIVGLIILTQGLFAGLRVVLVSIAGVTLVGYLLIQSPLTGVAIGLVQWLPVMLLAEVWRRSRSLSLMLTAGALLSLLAVGVQYLLWPDSDRTWMDMIRPMFQQEAIAEADRVRLDETLTMLAYWMKIVLVAVMYSTFVATLLAARWFQARLAGSDGYREEFRAIRLGRLAATVALLLTVAALLLRQDWLLSMLMVVLAAFLYQGLSVLHGWAALGQRGWALFALYLLMLIFPQVVAAVATLGVIDNWANFRAYLKPPSQTDE